MPPTPPSPSSLPARPAVALFDRQIQARQAIQALRTIGVAESQVGLLVPSAEASQPTSPAADVSGLLALAAGAGDLGSVLISLGLPDGEARFYAQEVAAGRTLVVVNSTSTRSDEREALLRHGGYDVQTRGGDMARPSGAGVPGGTGAKPIDVSANWADVSSRYEMLWQQHYGTTDATWQDVEPVYQYAWQVANEPSVRGRPWAEVEAALRRTWESSQPGMGWSDVAGPLRDVWEDVAAEAAQGAEGGQDRRIARPGTDQQVATADLAPPTT